MLILGAFIRDFRARKIERKALSVRYYLNQIRIIAGFGVAFFKATCHKSVFVKARTCKFLKGVQILRLDERLVRLDIDDDLAVFKG
mgnify:CR=1 FL=1